jgi:glucan 1,3-beta-glucosidase
MIRGVNLGGWLVLEKWMTPSVFAGSTARDEYGLSQELGTAAIERLTRHRDMFMTEADFRWISEHGLTAVRLPVGYWILGNEPPLVGGIEYVDKAFEWAERYGLKILLDLHGAPGSQNGRDHSGKVGDIAWANPENISKSLKVIEQLAARYKGRGALLGIELLNEPAWLNGRRRLRDYYQRGYDTVRARHGTEVAVVISDAYRPKRWSRAMQNPRYQQRWLDIHMYQLFARRDKKLNILGHLHKIHGSWHKLLTRVSRHWPVMVGEWSLALVPETFEGMTDGQKDAAMRAYGSAQLLLFEELAVAWFYWSYRTEHAGAWNYRSCVENGWLPATYQ